MIDPEIRVCIFSNNTGISRPFVQQIKEEFESNHILKRVYNDVLWEKPRIQAPSWSVAAASAIRSTCGALPHRAQSCIAPRCVST